MIADANRLQAHCPLQFFGLAHLCRVDSKWRSDLNVQAARSSDVSEQDADRVLLAFSFDDRRNNGNRTATHAVGFVSLAGSN